MTSQIENALTKFGYKEPTMSELAKFIGFNDDELTKLQLLWLPVYSNGWIYLSDEIILGQLTKETGKDAIVNFIKRLLIGCDDYIENVHYKIIKKDDDLVTAYSNFYSLNSTIRKTSNRKKYYTITGDTYEDLLMKSKTTNGRSSRLLYRKVVKLAGIMKDYISGMQLYQLNKQKILLDETTTKVENMRIINERVQNHINNTKSLDKTSTFYIATSKRYAEQNIFKPGCIDTIGEKALKSRLAQYNTGKTGDDIFYFCHIEEVYAAKELDYKLKKLLQQLKFNRKKEMVVVHYSSLIKIVKHVSDNHTEDYEYFNDFISSGEYKLTLDLTPIVPPPVIFNNHTLTIKEHKNGEEIKTHTIDVANLNDDQKKEYLIRAIEIFCTSSGTPYDHKTEKDNKDKKITLIWKDLQTILKNICHVKNLGSLIKWKMPLKNIDTNSKSIEQIKWIKKHV
jgi:hypothetical protein